MKEKSAWKHIKQEKEEKKKRQEKKQEQKELNRVDKAWRFPPMCSCSPTGTMILQPWKQLEDDYKGPEKENQ